MKLLSEFTGLPRKYALGIAAFVIGLANTAAVVMLAMPFFLQNPYFYCNDIRVSQAVYCNCVGQRYLDSSQFTSMSKLYQRLCIGQQTKFQTTLVAVKNISELGGYLLSMVVGFGPLNYLRVCFAIIILGFGIMIGSWNQYSVITGYALAQIGFSFLEGRGCNQFLKLFQHHAMDGISMCYIGFAFFSLFNCLAYILTSHFKVMTVVAAGPGLLGLAFFYLSEPDLQLPAEQKAEQIEPEGTEQGSSWVQLAKHMLFYVMSYFTYNLIILFMNTLLWGSIAANVAAITAAELLVYITVIFLVMGTEGGGRILSGLYIASGLLLVVAQFTGKFTIGIVFLLKVVIDFQWLLQVQTAKEQLSPKFMGYYLTGRQFLASLSLLLLPFYKQFMLTNGFQGYLPVGLIVFILAVITFIK